MADNSKDTRLARELESRDTQERPKQWKRPEVLPEPNQEPGYTYRWVRVAMLGQQDPRNVSSKTREGWEPVPASEQSHLQMLVDPNSRFKDNIEVAGLLLCKMPNEMVEQRREYFAKQNQSQMDSVDNNFMRENDQRMPLFSEKRSTTSFGKGK
jgi:hypothetical protein|tara:strand:+ start:2085 stop:2546 length:462 start_codon:yes stop_codon:yes gene_type:complete